MWADFADKNEVSACISRHQPNPQKQSVGAETATSILSTAGESLSYRTETKIALHPRLFLPR